MMDETNVNEGKDLDKYADRWIGKNLNYCTFALRDATG